MAENEKLKNENAELRGRIQAMESQERIQTIGVNNSYTTQSNTNALYQDVPSFFQFGSSPQNGSESQDLLTMWQQGSYS